LYQTHLARCAQQGGRRLKAHEQPSSLFFFDAARQGILHLKTNVTFGASTRALMQAAAAAAASVQAEPRTFFIAALESSPASASDVELANAAPTSEKI
jgi:hypothetical protein